MHTLSVKSLRQKLDNKEISSVELTRHFLDRINKLNPTINAIITETASFALQSAEIADQLITQGKQTQLTGIPIIQKDIFCTKGIKTSAGSKMLDSFISPYNATIVEKCNAAGAVLLGKANMDEFAMGSSNENSYYGAVKNPWNLNTAPGGSSGGSAAAIAAGFSPIATGTDTGGSIRQPAALCGISGLKPTYGRVSRYGMIAFASSLDQGGPMAKSAEDLAYLLNVMAGFDQRDSTSVNKPVEDYTLSLEKPLNGMKIGLPKEYFSDQLNSEMQKIIEDAIDVYKKLGASIKEVSLAHSQLALPAYYIIAPSECSSNLARYDGVRYGYRSENPIDLIDMYKRSRSEAFGDEVKRRIMVGTYALSSGYYDAYYAKAQKIRRLISEDFQSAFKDVDIILAPTTPSTAFNLGEKSSDPVSMYLSDIYTIPVNLAGLPAMSIPAGFCNNLPVGIQLIGNAFKEDQLLNAAHQFQLNTDYHKQTPALEESY
ncbi:Asp-tRNA(Asn)/Glu-tRNA(Gln) amidotransferase subunit GatA [Thiotrichales bacterium 19S3-7]|nr:Asp-tRNA(Asn)/Glu-tRNA(Gln) amidotransferase subunit GatA [Thiotrichales bacterium 19S3-7]MCF6802506.1 Asp-tRNA(Asn)/Glu-tRNA(Gln) amidotransferase subunit GatA [Thiotrichales bacterium 19S3-11]